MVSYCAAYNCTMKKDEQARKLGVAFHSFPKDAVRRKKWTLAVRRKNFTPGLTATLCSTHFEPECFEQSGWSSTRRLTSDALPTIFNFPRHLCKSNPTPRKPPATRNSLQPTKKKYSKKQLDVNLIEEDAGTNHPADLTEHQAYSRPLDLTVCKPPRRDGETRDPPSSSTVRHVTPYERVYLQRTPAPMAHWNSSSQQFSHEGLKSLNVPISSSCPAKKFNYPVQRIFPDNLGTPVSLPSPVVAPNTTSSSIAAPNNANVIVAKCSTAKPRGPAHNNQQRESNVGVDLSTKSATNTKKPRKPRKAYVGDFTLEDMSDPVLARAFHRVFNKEMEAKTRKIHTLTQSNRREQKKLEQLEIKVCEKIRERLLNMGFSSEELTK